MKRIFNELSEGFENLERPTALVFTYVLGLCSAAFIMWVSFLILA